MAIPVLMYHALEDRDHPAGACDPGEQRYVLPLDTFREQMQYLHDNGYATFLFDELSGLSKWPERGLVLTFDDGHQSNFTLALPVLQQFGFRAEFFVTSAWIGTPRYLTEEQLLGLRSAGMGVGSHGVTHRFLDDLNAGEVRNELALSKQRLSRITGERVTSFSAPGGRLHRTLKREARELGYGVICTSTPGLLTQRGKWDSVPRLAVQADADLFSFVDLCAGNPRRLRTLRRNHYILWAMKKMLGNDMYEKLREAVLTGK